MRTITLIPGDGIGPSVVEAAVRVVEATGVKINWDRVEAGMSALESSGHLLPARTINSIKKNRIALKGPLATPIGEGFSSVNVQLRKVFDLYMNFRPVKSFPGISPFKNVNILVFRENIEDFYAGEPQYVDIENTVAELTGTISYRNSYRFFYRAFNLARANKRRKITVGHKANIFKMYHGLFLDAARDVASQFPEIELREEIIDALCMKLVTDPTKFDCVAAPNVFGDILSDLCAGLVGGLGIAPGANYGDSTGIFEAVHGSAPDIEGKNVANPTAVILSAAMMLEHVGEVDAAYLIRSAIERIIEDKKFLTVELNPEGVGTIEMTDAIVEKVSSMQELRKRLSGVGRN